MTCLQRVLKALFLFAFLGGKTHFRCFLKAVFVCFLAKPLLAIFLSVPDLSSEVLSNFEAKYEREQRPYIEPLLKIKTMDERFRYLNRQIVSNKSSSLNQHLVNATRSLELLIDNQKPGNIYQKKINVLIKEAKKVALYNLPSPPISFVETSSTYLRLTSIMVEIIQSKARITPEVKANLFSDMFQHSTELWTYPNYAHSNKLRL